jgi:hypothetical protein
MRRVPNRSLRLRQGENFAREEEGNSSSLEIKTAKGTGGEG